MSSRYAQLRQAIAALAASADEQAAYLLSQGLDASYGNDELALVFDDIAPAVQDMRDRGELSAAQAEVPQALSTLLDGLSGDDNAAFWTREALWTDPRWEEVRRCAQTALAAFPE